MAIRAFLQGLGATHLFDLNNNGLSTTDDLGSSLTPTNLTLGSYSSFVPTPICEGVTHSLQTVSNTSDSIEGAIATNRDDINTSANAYQKYSVMMWALQQNIWNPTCVYEQGRGVNNFAIMGGALTTWQAADSGQPFLIVQSKNLTQSNRPYLYIGIWERYTEHAGNGNRVLFYINGVLQGISELNGTDSFPSHVGNIALGNSAENLKSFNETTFTSQTVAKNCNFWGTFNDQTLTAADCREIFERTTLAQITIASDTVANQQAALDALSGNTYQDLNCAIRILQATDATDYRLYVDNINFIADDNIQDISIQFVGTGVLTLENTNGTVIKYVSSPAEVEKTSGVITGGGSIVVIDGTIRYKAPATITKTTAKKLVIESTGTYTLDQCTIDEVVNNSNGSVILILKNNSAVETNTGPNITINTISTLTLTGLKANSEVRVYDAGTTTEIAGVENSGTSFSANISASSVDIVVHSIGYEYQKIEGADTSANLTLPIQQRVDRNYRNP